MSRGDGSIKSVGSGIHAPKQIVSAAEKLANAHGCEVVLTQERSGYHLYLPCPDCLHTHGRRELEDPKYSINLSVVTGLGEESKTRFIPHEMQDRDAKVEWRSSICMRTRMDEKPHRYSFTDLNDMSSVTSRHPDILTKAKVRGNVSTKEREEHWEADPVTGVMCPPRPGETVALSKLPANHPAIIYLKDRKFDPVALEDQFNCEFCTKEYTEKENGIFYRKFPGGWKDTPQHRIIFKSMLDGTPMTWQGRLIERISGDGLSKYMLHPYAGGGPYNLTDTSKVRRIVESTCPGAEVQICGWPGNYWGYAWSHTHTRSNTKSSWIPVSPFNELRNGKPRFTPSKYRTAKYSTREMMGWDAAERRADNDPEQIPWALLCEGPLDAGRAGPGGIALIGPSITPANAAKLAARFKFIISAFDTDRVGTAATKKISEQLFSANHTNVLQTVLQLPINQGKDLGAMPQAQFDELLAKIIKNIKRSD